MFLNVSGFQTFAEELFFFPRVQNLVFQSFKRSAWSLQCISRP